MREGQTRDEGGRVEIRKQGRGKGGPHVYHSKAYF